MRRISEWVPTRYNFVPSQSVGPAVAVASILPERLAVESLPPLLSTYARGDFCDLGCGEVPLFPAYSGLVSSITCIDWPSSGHINRHCDCLADLNISIPIVDQAFDCILMSSVLEHIRKPEMLIDECLRVLRPGGSLILVVPFMYGIHEAPHDYFRYTEYSLRSMAMHSGFNIVEVRPMGGAIESLCNAGARLAWSLRSGTPEWTTPAWRILVKLIQAIPFALIRTGTGRRLREHSGGTTPLAYVCVFRRPVL